MIMSGISFTSFLFIFIISPKINAQFVDIGLGGGLTQVLGSDSYTNDIINNGLGYSTEINFGVIAKLSFPVLPITPRGILLVHKFNGNANSLKNSQTVSSIGLGVQYEIIPIPLGLEPYFSLDVIINNFGEYNGTVITGPNSPEPLFIIPDGSRFGLQVGVGVEVRIIPNINVDLYTSYNWLNIVGKENNEEALSALSLDAFLLFSIL